MTNDSDNYKAVSCEHHSQLELAIMQQTKLNLSWLDSDNIEHCVTVLPVDMISRNKAEFVKVTIAGSEVYEIRLDKILSFTPA